MKAARSPDCPAGPAITSGRKAGSAPRQGGGENKQEKGEKAKRGMCAKADIIGAKGNSANQVRVSRISAVL